MEDDNWAIVKAIVSIGRSLNLSVVAEGVETIAQLGLLHSIGCEEAQGYLISKPLPADEMQTWLCRHRSLREAGHPKGSSHCHTLSPELQGRIVQIVPG
jgi:EAL domain-containing protein (putative c-di-GMP-specific phosphodiesterase class I)